MKWAPQGDDYTGEHLENDQYENEGILFMSGRILVKDALIRDGHEFCNGKKRIHYEKNGTKKCSICS